MSFDLEAMIEEGRDRAFDLHQQYINPSFVKVLRTIGFDKTYVKGKGQYLWDKDGEKYLDFLSGYGVFIVGRNHDYVRKILKKAMDLDLPNLIKMDAPLLSGMLAERLVKRCPNGLDSVFFANSGAEAVEAAMKFARAYTGREEFVYLDHAYHGLTMGALAINGCEHFRKGFGSLYPSTSVAFDSPEKLEDVLRTKRFAAFVFEPVQGKGVHYPKDDFYKQAQALCRKYGTLFIADEVQSGMGRTGKFFGFEHWGLDPDIVTISKGLSGGFVPVSAVLVRRDIHRKTFSSMERSVVHSTTFSQNDMAMAAGLAALHVIDEEKLVENAAKMGALFESKCKLLQQKYEMFKEYRGKGLMIGFEFGKPKSLKLGIGWKLVHTADKGLFGQMIVIPLLAKHRILTQVAGHQVDILKILPSLVINEEDVNWFVRAFDQTLAEAHQFPGAMWEVGAKLAKAALSQSFPGRDDRPAVHA
jgi:acetylornithine/succinyldiaminopimelate/putrescine aminotransferase